ncbi:TetR/AcrR family transcriptional regulator [Leptospira sp. 2 VSF19]|uniref:TetR/AcrR family transcriptional regulator n=1 Tax=Leptospira soteropolitanensis TaxID=2950025 RepID=A0AAW5VH83_9LEPT|nr:helix-turn-helix domain-containing protein [Leptospira soteropolitanensis]MCW7491833.1 TetR/AcrR family transcriptional regulator [Leptospira soteropolitanensis]MCW7499417.1 TetR/AcrR family transcriptional regulator [Leptospira soteropolitanensis]MCW7520992.1 TetR/AcrR family transcriptional regulator [Leptospira soteropolitanensis]MCW7525521.1 TetR/AcrR family transcriptional regulator [Leptospira soteropolitanensis]MCW7529387.1 TetR/AcrR family transcriptional regulator [Leptospira soter
MKLTLKLLQNEFDSYKSPQSEKEKNIVEAAEEVFAELGFAGATTAELAKRADVTERTLFKYFPSKSDLYRRVLSGLLLSTIVPGHMSDLKDRLQNLKPNFKEWYISILKARYAAVAKEPQKLKLLLGALLFSKEFSEIFGNLWKINLYDTSVEAIQYFQGIDEIRKDLDPNQIVRASFSLAASFLITKFVLAPKYPIDSDNEMESIFSIFYQGIENEK